VAIWHSGLTGAGRLSAKRFGTRKTVARTSPGEFIRQVRAETAKVVWPSNRETMMTAVMVVLMTTILGIFFFGLDTAFSAVVKALLSFVAQGS
jgi:preprotein translocase subunit SecE